jgi:nucleotide-binding universal stress UspA family protein
MRAVARPLDDPCDSPVLRDARAAAWRHGVAASLQRLRGDPPPAILATAADHHADLLVIGARQHRRPWPAQARTGRWIQQHATCQVFTPAHRGELAL